MCSPACIAFGREHLRIAEICRKSVLEVGALNVNGSLRETITAHDPAMYIGVDIALGPGVDEICDAERLVERFGQDRFDLVVCTEVLEHVRRWRQVVSNLKRVLRPGGVLLMTTRSVPFGYHGYPADFWRYSEADCRHIFADMWIRVMTSDPESPGVFLCAIKPGDFVERQLDDVCLYSILKSKRCNDIGEIEARILGRYWSVRPRIVDLIPPPMQRPLKSLVAHRRMNAARDRS